jgi:hypothetical protein
MSDELRHPTRKRSWTSIFFRMRLGTLMMLVALAGVGSAYYTAHANRVRWQSKLNRTETAIGLPRISDLEKLEVIATTDPARQGYLGTQASWMIWVPFGSKGSLRYATKNLTSEFPSGFSEVKLGQGRHTVVLTQERGIWDLAVDKVSLFRGEPTRDWNISLPWKHRLGSRSQPTKSEVLLHAVGSVRLTIDEEYDRAKHSFGLKIWLVPLPQ